MDRPQIFSTLNNAAEQGDIFSALRMLPLDVVADALMEMPSNYPAARAALPVMASDEVQDHWTGKHGHSLLFQSCAFARSLELGFLKYTGRSLQDKRLLDYGCGWGRLIRLMYAFTAPENIYACDPWQKSIDICNAANVKAHLALCDYLPKDIPFTGVKFDLIYAFSVFTHLSERTAEVILAACHRAIERNGLLAVTIRPESYWTVHQAPADIPAMVASHRQNHYAFTPHIMSPGQGSTVLDSDGKLTYGDASFSIDYIKKHWTDWEVAGTDVSLLDPHQTIVFLRPR